MKQQQNRLKRVGRDFRNKRFFYMWRPQQQFCQHKQWNLAVFLRYVRTGPYPGEAQEMVLDAFVRALAFYDGVPRRVIIDNPKTMVTYVSRSKDRVISSSVYGLHEPLCD